MASHIAASFTVAATRPSARPAPSDAPPPITASELLDTCEARPRLPPAARIEQLRHASFAELEDLYLRASPPTRVPTGRAVGEHVVVPGTQAELPWLVELAALHFWRAKEFDAHTGLVRDHVALFPDTRARLSLGTMNGHRALITDYTAVDNFPVRVKWKDELREIEPNVWLGRSFYDGELWAHVLLRFEG